MAAQTLDQAIQAAIKLNEDVGKKGVAAAYSELEDAVRAFEGAGNPLESIIPQGGDAQLGFSLRSADGKSFFDIYSRLLRKQLCTRQGEFNKLIRSGIDSSVGAVLTSIVVGLGIPVA